MDRNAWPQGYRAQPKEEFNLDKWKDTALKITMATRQYGDEYSSTDIMNHLLQDWDYQEKDHFKQWWRYNQQHSRPLYSKGQDNMTIKTAYDYNTAHKDERLNDLKKKLRSRCTSAEKLLNTMMDEGLLGNNEEKAVYIGRILQKLKEEVNMLKRPALIEARHKRVKTILRKAGFDELANIVADSVNIVSEFRKRPFVKIARSDFDLKGVLEDIRTELDAVNYGTHLERMMSIKAKLEGAGRHSEAGMVVDIIKKELSNLDGIHKKLVELYSSLSAVPRSNEPREKHQGPKPNQRQEKPVPTESETDELGIELPEEPNIEFPEEARTVPGM